MGFRSRALLGGVATGFLKSNNDRRTRMEQRMQELADSNATMARERAKSRYDATAKEAEAKTIEQRTLKESGHIDDKGNFTRQYYDTTSYAEFQKPEVRKAFGGDYEKFKVEYAKMQPKKFVNPYKSPDEIQRDLSKLYESIDAKQRVESSQPVLTGIDKMLARGAAKGVNLVGEGINSLTGGRVNVTSGLNPTEPNAVPELATFDPMRPQSNEPAAPYESPSFASPKVEARNLDKIIVDKEGKNFALFANNKGEVEKVDLGINTGTTTSSAPRQVEKVRIFDREKNVYFDEPVTMDKVSGEIRINGEWIKPGAGLATMPADVKLIDLVYKDPTTGDEMSAQAYQTVGSATGENIVRQPDGTTFATTGIPILYRGKRDEHETARNTLPEAVKKNLDEFAMQRKTASLSSLLLKQDFTSDPVNWAQANLSAFTDMIGFSIGMKGDNRATDLESIASWVNSEIQDNEELKNKIGFLDAAAVRSGNKDALENFLVYSLARSQFGSGRLNVNAITSAEEVVKPLMAGSDYNRGALEAVVARSSDEMARIAGSDITLAMGAGPTSKIWEYYPRVKQKVDAGLVPVAERVDGRFLISKINKLDNASYQKTFRNLVDVFGTDWEAALNSPIKFDKDYDTIVMPMYKENKDGSLTFGVFAAK